MPITVTANAAREHIGEEVGLSDWLTIEQDRIDAFADATNDHQYIHIDAEAAERTPFGSTIAHGFLTLSLLTDLAGSSGLHLENTDLLINYGMNKVRFLAPVNVNDEIRARTVLREIEEKRPGQHLITNEVTIEIKGKDKPALIAEWLTMAFTH